MIYCKYLILNIILFARLAVTSVRYGHEETMHRQRFNISPSRCRAFAREHERYAQNAVNYNNYSFAA
jgi:hypothetical protein